MLIYKNFYSTELSSRIVSSIYPYYEQNYNRRFAITNLFCFKNTIYTLGQFYKTLLFVNVLKLNFAILYLFYLYLTYSKLGPAQ
jgi:hypothetical protein